MMNIQEIRSKFPAIVNNPDFIFFDNASTSQKPSRVIEAMDDYHKTYCANAGRGSYRWANKVSQEIETVREKVKNFIHATSKNEVVFTSGATDSFNTIVYSWALNNLKNNDEVMICATDHKSLILPWLNIKSFLKNFGLNINIVYITPDPSGDYVFDDIQRKVTKRTKIINLTDVHNVYGVDMGVKEIRERVGNDIIISVDASQSIGHKQVDVKSLGADFLAFSAHKMFGETGLGVLWVNERLHDSLTLYKVGGGYEGNIDWGTSTLQNTKMPELLEHGTQNISGIVALGSAIDFIEEIGPQNIENHLVQLSNYLLEKLKSCNVDIEFLPGPVYCSRCQIAYGILGFKIRDVSSSDVGFILDDHNIFVRTGNHCIGNGDSFQDDSVRVSLQIYNTMEEINRFIEILEENFPRG
jgi:cysteine desulfurase / selenocysteine lyase